jgi:hypothetical protein
MWSGTPGGTPTRNNIRFLGFNQDTTRLFVGTTEGSQTYQCETAKPFELLYDKGGEGTMMMEMLFSSCLVAHVGAGEGAASSQRCLRIINTRTEKLIQQINYPSAVLARCLPSPPLGTRSNRSTILRQCWHGARPTVDADSPLTRGLFHPPI